MARGDYNFPGVYLITNTINGKVYVGSSVNVANRIHCHQSHIRSGCHHNKHLLAAVNQYNIDNFIFELWECCDADQLKDRESYWINVFDSANNAVGYNNSTDTTCPARGRRQSKQEIEKRLHGGILKSRKFVDSNGVVFETNNTKEFAKSQNLTYSSLTAVANKNRYSYRGWRLATRDTIGFKFKDIRVGKPKLGRKF